MHGIGAVPDETIVRIAVFRRWPQGAPLVLGVALATLIAGLDLLTGPDVSMSMLYVLAVMAVTWAGTRRHGILVAVLAATESLGARALRADRAIPRIEDVSNVATMLVVLLLVTALLGSLRRALVAQRRLATVDPLTGAMNRRSFGIAAERERLRAAREGRPLTVAYIDLDGFKAINDRLGHGVGDDLLTEFAGLVQDTIRRTDLFARIGGDEFAVLLPETDAAQASTVVERLRGTVVERRLADGALTISVGVATYRFPPEHVDAMLAAADDLMYRAKRRGGNRMVGAVVPDPWLRWADRVLLPDDALARLG